MGRLGKAEEIANLALYLGSDDILVFNNQNTISHGRQVWLLAVQS